MSITQKAFLHTGRREAGHGEAGHGEAGHGEEGQKDADRRETDQKNRKSAINGGLLVRLSPFERSSAADAAKTPGDRPTASRKGSADVQTNKKHNFVSITIDCSMI